MKIRVADYIAETLAAHGIRHVFSVTGGGAMYLNDGLGHHPLLQCIYNHHEQACAMAAESYARVHNRMAAVCVTTGPGGTNAITGVLGGWLDSIPMLILSGQVRYDTTARSTGLDIRAMGDQEFDITRAVGCMTKFAEMVTDPDKIRYCLEKAIHLAQSGRPGPCWLDIPLNVQGAYVETEELCGYDLSEDTEKIPRVTGEQIALILDKLRSSNRPVLNVGNGVRIAGAAEVLGRVIEKLNIPVVTGWNSIDLIEDEHPLYVGRAGIMGDRPGNWAVQNCDLFLSIGSRLSIRQVGYNHSSWARAAYTIVEDVDQEELKKPDIHVDYPIWADARDLLEALDAAVPAGRMPIREEWNARCQYWKKEFPVVQKCHYAQSEPANVYAFIHKLSSSLAEGDITVVGNGSACVVGSHAYVIKKGQRFVINSAVASMGYDLPAAIGACVASGGRQIVCVSGDGSIQMNLQELQTIIHHRMPIKIFVINNGGYHSIRQTQMNFFGEPLVGIGAESGDLSFPDLEKLAGAYGYPYIRISSNNQLGRVQSVLETEGPMLCEVMVDAGQKFEPKAASRRMEDGTMVSAPLEDLAPFLPREVLKQQMYIPLVDEV